MSGFFSLRTFFKYPAQNIQNLVLWGIILAPCMNIIYLLLGTPRAIVIHNQVKNKRDYYARLADWRENQEVLYKNRFDEFIAQNNEMDAHVKAQSL